jgi:hypothetical protein
VLDQGLDPAQRLCQEEQAGVLADTQGVALGGELDRDHSPVVTSPAGAHLSGGEIVTWICPQPRVMHGRDFGALPQPLRDRRCPAAMGAHSQRQRLEAAQ